MIGEQLLGKGVQSRVGGGYLGQDVGTVGTALHHAPDAPDLAFHPVQAVDEPLVFLLGALLGLVASKPSSKPLASNLEIRPLYSFLSCSSD